MAMVAQNTNLSLGHKTMQYDIIGTTQINSLSDILNAVVKQDSARLGTDLEQFTQRFVFAPLGMTQSTWSGGSATKSSRTAGAPRCSTWPASGCSCSTAAYGAASAWSTKAGFTA